MARKSQGSNQKRFRGPYAVVLKGSPQAQEKVQQAVGRYQRRTAYRQSRRMPEAIARFIASRETPYSDGGLGTPISKDLQEESIAQYISDFNPYERANHTKQLRKMASGYYSMSTRYVRGTAQYTSTEGYYRLVEEVVRRTGMSHDQAMAIFFYHGIN